MKPKQRVPALRGGQPDDLASNRGSCDRISLRRTSMRRKITLNNPGIWGMSDNNGVRRCNSIPATDHASARSRGPLSGRAVLRLNVPAERARAGLAANNGPLK
jgi:hypothetical protein